MEINRIEHLTLYKSDIEEALAAWLVNKGHPEWASVTCNYIPERVVLSRDIPLDHK